MNLQNLMKQAQSMQNNLMKAKKEIDSKEFIGKSELVEVTVYGNKKIKSIFILEYLILTLVAFILHIFIIPFIYKFALNIISQNPDLFVLKIYVNCIGSLLYTLFVSLLVFIIFNIKFKKVLN